MLSRLRHPNCITFFGVCRCGCISVYMCIHKLIACLYLTLLRFGHSHATLRNYPLIYLFNRSSACSFAHYCALGSQSQGRDLLGDFLVQHAAQCDVGVAAEKGRIRLSDIQHRSSMFMIAHVLTLSVQHVPTFRQLLCRSFMKRQSFDTIRAPLCYPSNSPDMRSTYRPLPPRMWVTAGSVRFAARETAYPRQILRKATSVPHY